MENNKQPKKIVLIFRRDIICSLWKVTLEADIPYPDKKNIERAIRYIRMVYPKRFKTYDEDSCSFEVWSENRYRVLDYNNIKNVEGKNWPLDFDAVTLFPEARIQDESDLAMYNRWRVNTFRSYVHQLQNNYIWELEGGVCPPKDCKRGWIDINPETDILPINPVELSDVLLGSERFVKGYFMDLLLGKRC